MEKKGGWGWRESRERWGGNGTGRPRHRYTPFLFSLQGCKTLCHTANGAETPYSSPAHAMLTNPSHIASRCTYKQKTRLKLSSVRLAAIQTLLPDLQVIPVSVCLQRVRISVVSSCGGASCELSTWGLCICFSEYLPQTFAPSITIVKLWCSIWGRYWNMWVSRSKLWFDQIQQSKSCLFRCSRCSSGISLSFSVGGDQGRCWRVQISARFHYLRHGTGVKTS